MDETIHLPVQLDAEGVWVTFDLNLCVSLYFDLEMLSYATGG